MTYRERVEALSFQLCSSWFTDTSKAAEIAAEADEEIASLKAEIDRMREYEASNKLALEAWLSGEPSRPPLTGRRKTLAGADVQRDMRLDTPIGAKVIFVACGGYDAERALAEKVLTVGRAYTVSAIDIGGFTSTVTIDGLGSFNTVMFQNVPQNPQLGETDE